MKRVIFLLSVLLSINLFASFEEMNSFHSNFRQTVTSDGESIVYSGELYIKKPHLLFWKYVEPVNKSIYINRDTFIMIEPDLEQVIVKNISNTMQFIKVLESSKKVSEDRYIAQFDGRKYLILLKDNKLYRIIYNDELENSVEITLTEAEVNREIDDAIFIPEIGDDFDRIYQ